MIHFLQEDTVNINGIPSSFYVATSSNRIFQRIVDIRLLWKLGLQYDVGQWGIGFTLTTPSFSVYGDGSAKHEVSRSQIYDPSTDLRLVDLAVADYQENVKANLKDPLSLALGLHYRSPDNKNSLLFTAEYFFPIEIYNMLELEEGTQQSTPAVQDSIRGSIIPSKRRTNSVFNIALGYRKYLNEKVSFLGGFRTDFSAADQKTLEDNSFVLTRIPYDQFHLTAGSAVIIKEKFELLGGLQFSRGYMNNVDQLANFSDPIEYNPQTGQSLQGVLLPEMEVKYLAFSLFFGFSYEIFK